MARISFRLIPALVFAASLTLPSNAQNSTPKSQPQPTGNQVSQNQTAQPAFMLRTFTRMVTLELVVEDSRHQHIDGLKASDFQIEEQTPSKSGKRYPQKIVEFREVHVANLAPPAAASHASPGVYSNAVTVQKDPVQPTILLVDGLNTPLELQAQVHVQMLKMLRQLPPNVPVAVFLLGDRLVMLQSFTTDPKLLQAVLNKAISTAGVGVARMDPRDDPDAAEKLVGGELTEEAPMGDTKFAEMAAAASNFDQKIFSATTDERVLRTINALYSLGHNVAGYPGRKNLLWLSTSFPISLASIGAAGDYRVGAMKDLWTEVPNYQGQLRRLSAVLSDAKVAVYPMNLAGVQTLQAFQAGARPPDLRPTNFSDNTTRDTLTQNASVDTMHEIADDTGGRVCTGDNDLGDCVRKAVDDSGDFYEISYYPDSP